MFTTCSTSYNIDRHLMPFMSDCSFYAHLSQQMMKRPTKEIPTAAVAYDARSETIVLYYNPDFMETLTDGQTRGVIKHEFSHVVFGHLTTRRKDKARLWNVATDLAINSMIVTFANASNKNAIIKDELPEFALLPGKFPKMPDGRTLSAEEKAAMPMALAIEQFPEMMSSDFYYAELLKLAREEAKKGKGSGDGDFDPDGEPFEGEGWDSMDDHENWDNGVTEENRSYVESKVRDMVRKAVHHADQTSNGWGNISADIRESIRASVNSVIDWRAVLRQFIGNIIRGQKTSSIKRINRRFPYVHPGTKRGYVAKLLLARDESGSVSDEMLCDFFTEMAGLTRKVEIDFVPFDCNCDVKDVVRWKRGQAPPGAATTRTKCGGTNFSAPTEVFNDPKNRGRWDGLLILTDGQADTPIQCRGKRGWVLGKGCNLAFTSTELQIKVSREQQIQGAWR